METLIKAGDIVRVKISNQQMIVKGFATKPSSQGAVMIYDRYECEWNIKGKKQKAVFHKDSLELLAPYHDYLHNANYE